MDVLAIKGLKKSFGDKEVLRGVDLSIPDHSVFGFVGRNGAGKTTTMKSILGLIKPDSGEIYVSGERVSFGETSTNKYVGYLPDVPQFYPFMTAREYLSLCGESINMSKGEIKERSDELLCLVGLENETHRIKGFSRGMKQRLGIAQALFSRPRLLICDEPTSALDPIGRREILGILSTLKEQTTVLFSTHILSDVERIATDVALLSDGVIAMQGSVDELKKMHATDSFTLELNCQLATEMILKKFNNAIILDECTLSFNGNDEKMFEVIDFIKANSISFCRLERDEASLEALFMEVVKK